MMNTTNTETKNAETIPAQTKMDKRNFTISPCRKNRMRPFRDLYYCADEKITTYMKDYGILFLRISVGIIFFWFGVLKFFPGLSPAHEIATITIGRLTFGFIPENVAIIILATWETLIGIGLIFGVFLRITLFLLFTQMLGTMTPLLLFPGETFTIFPYAPTLEGQYIIKNLVLISAGLVVGTTVQGGRTVGKKAIEGSEEEMKQH